jgi:hypothetical protein
MAFETCLRAPNTSEVGGSPAMMRKPVNTLASTPHTHNSRWGRVGGHGVMRIFLHPILRFVRSLRGNDGFSGLDTGPGRSRRLGR